MVLDTRELVGNTDALVWAEDFTERFEGFEITAAEGGPDEVDTGTMIGWFANAIMAGFDDGYSRQQRDINRLKFALNRGWNRAQFEYAGEHDLWVDDELGDILPALKTEPRFGDATEYEVLPSHPTSPSGVSVTEVAPVNPTEHVYPDEVVGRMAQEIEDLYDVLGDLIANAQGCEYDTTEFCITHGVGRPCPFELARSLINAK